jgi:23S rRNA (uracil1939-C5)-methyltransferase
LYVDIIGGDVARELPGLLPASYAVIDPPRSGMSPEARTALAESGLDGIVYVSCDPITLARDLKFLCESGYRLIEATPVDLFPQSHHVETVVLMSRVEK